MGRSRSENRWVFGWLQITTKESASKPTFKHSAEEPPESACALLLLLGFALWWMHCSSAKLSHAVRLCRILCVGYSFVRRNQKTRHWRLLFLSVRASRTFSRKCESREPVHCGRWPATPRRSRSTSPSVSAYRTSSRCCWSPRRNCFMSVSVAWQKGPQSACINLRSKCPQQQMFRSRKHSQQSES